MKSCLFCGTVGSGSLTKEHVIPQWLLSHLGLPDDDQIFQGVANSGSGELVGPPRIHSSYAFVDGRVCDSCNSGWMSRLENAAIPVLTPLMDRSRTVDSLGRQETFVLAKWAAKTAYLHSWVGPLQRPVQRSHLEALRGDNGTPVLGVGVFAMQDSFVQPSAYIQTGHWPQFATSSPGSEEATPAEAYKVGLQFHHLYLLVAYWPNQSSIFVRLRNMHEQLLPSTTVSGTEYSIELGIGDGPIDRLAAFTNWLAVVHPHEAV